MSRSGEVGGELLGPPHRVALPLHHQVGTPAPRSSSTRVFSGLPGRVQGKGQGQQPTRTQAASRSAAPERAPADRPPTTSGVWVRSELAAAARARRRGWPAGSRPCARPRRQGCSKSITLTPLRRQRARPAPSGRGRRRPRPAPWLSSRVAMGRFARRTCSRPSPCGRRSTVGGSRRFIIEIASSSGSGSTSSGPLLRTLLTSGGDGVGLEAAGRRRDEQRAARPPTRGSSQCTPPVALDHQRHPVVDVAQRVLGLGGEHRAGPPEAVGVVVGQASGRARSRRARPSPGRRRRRAG